MTSGQERAARELRRLHAADPDGFELVVSPEVVDGTLIAVVGLRIGNVETAPGGLDLRDREEFVLTVPPEFPFQRPYLTVAHERFAGFPHVVWTHSICLYRSPNDWNPQDGLYGFFDKLRQWLWKAAVNDMDPADLPLEPPHAQTDFSQPPFVVRADVPEIPGKFWIGFALLEKYPSRTELVGWCDAGADWPAGKKPGLAILLSEPLPMEFPANGGEFFRELEKQHVDRTMVVRLLAIAARLVDDEEPNRLEPRDALAMVKRRARAANLGNGICCHTFRATGITNYLENKGTIEKAQQIAAHASPTTTKLYDRTDQQISLEEIEKIQI